MQSTCISLLLLLIASNSCTLLLAASNTFFDWTEFLNASTVYRAKKLIISLRKEDWTQSSLLLTKKIAINYADQSAGRTALWYTLFDKQGRPLNPPRYDLANQLIRLGARIDSRDANGCTLFWMAARHHNIEIMKWLLTVDGGHEIDINARDNIYGFTPLIVALTVSTAAAGNRNRNKSALLMEIFELLIFQNARLDLHDLNGQSALFAAIHAEQCDLVKRLIDLGAQVAESDNSDCQPLHYALRVTSPDCARYLIESERADIEARDPTGNTPLILTVLLSASHKRSIILLDLLKNKGADLNAQNNRGSTALHLAVWQKRIYLVEYFLESGAEIDLKDKDGNTPLLAAVVSNSPIIVEILLSRGANVNNHNKKLETALILAPAAIDPIMLRSILRRQPIIDWKDSLNRTALHYAVLENLPQKTELLVKVGARQDILDVMGMTPLILASAQGNLVTITALLRPALSQDSHLVLSVNQQNELGKTALMFAIEAGKFLVARVLVEKYGASFTVSPVDWEGHDAHWYATMESLELAAELQELEARRELFYSANSSPENDYDNTTSDEDE